MKFITSFLSLFVLAINLFAQGSLESDVRTNGKETRKAFSRVESWLSEGTAVFYDKNLNKGRNHVFYGTLVSSDGWILTKASMLSEDADYQVRIGRKLYKAVDVYSRDEAWDVALVKVDASGLKFPNFAEKGEVPQGTWVICTGAVTRYTRRPRVGVFSANVRRIPPAPASMGIVVDPEKNEVVIGEVNEKGGAHAAGLKKGDQILAVDGKKVDGAVKLFELLSEYEAGTEVEVTYLRGEDEKTAKVLLKSRVEVFGVQMTRNDGMSGRFSSRREDFPKVLQHDIFLSPRSVGGPLYTLAGDCIGMNIARADRVTSYAIPSEEVVKIFADLKARPQSESQKEELIDAENEPALD